MCQLYHIKKTQELFSTIESQICYPIYKKAFYMLIKTFSEFLSMNQAPIQCLFVTMENLWRLLMTTKGTVILEHCLTDPPKEFRIL